MKFFSQKIETHTGYATQFRGYMTKKARAINVYVEMFVYESKISRDKTIVATFQFNENCFGYVIDGDDPL